MTPGLQGEWFIHYTTVVLTIKGPDNQNFRCKIVNVSYPSVLAFPGHAHFLCINKLAKISPAPVDFFP